MPREFLRRSFLLRLESLKKLLGTNAGTYMAEGIMCTVVLSFAQNTNYLFLTRLGATDIQLGLIQFAPQLTNMLILLPGGIIADSFANKKKMVMFAMCMAAVFYVAIVFSPMLGEFKIFWFITMLSLSAGMITLYNTSWQSFFPEVIPVEERNKTLTLRQTWRLVPAVLIPLCTGMILSLLKDNESKITAHQTFFVISAVFVSFQVYFINKLKSVNPAPAMGISLTNLKKAAGMLAKNKKFLIFTPTILVFYIAFHLDWTFYFIGMTKYLGLNEAMLGVAIVVEALAQFLTIRFWSRLNEKYGVTLPLFFAMLLLAFFTPVMVLATRITSPLNLYVFFIGYAMCSVGLASVLLNVFQCLLQVLEDKFRTICISIFNMSVALSNAVMPITGVALYNFFGGDLNALHIVCWIVFIARMFAAFLWLLRWYLTERRVSAS